jgi:hypothetical protein
MKRGALLAIGAVILLASVLIVGFGHYRPSILSSRELAPKQPKPPRLPEDCGEIRRAVALSAQSIASGREKVTKIAVPLDADEVAIYKVVIQQWNGKHSAVLSVSAETYALDTTFSPEGAECGCWAGFPAENLLRASHSFHTLTQSDLPARGVRLVHPDEQNAVVARSDPGTTIRQGRSVEDAVNNAFANGLFSMSEIVFDQEHRRALVSYAFYCGALCGNGRTCVLEKINGSWKITDRECGGWVS